jgi:hypothetical protein
MNRHQQALVMKRAKKVGQNDGYDFFRRLSLDNYFEIPVIDLSCDATTNLAKYAFGLFWPFLD